MTDVKKLETKRFFEIGKERIHSLEILFQFFCHHLRCGQWELSRVCIDQLHKYGKAVHVNITQILSDLIRCPFDRSSPDSQLKLPYHLSWLCLQEYKRFVTVNEDTNTELLQKETEFCLLLFEGCCDVPSVVIKELYNYHQKTLLHHHDKAYKKTSDYTPRLLSSQLLQILQSKLIQNPLLGSNLITSLFVNFNHDQYKKNNEALHLLYIRAVNSILDKLSSKDAIFQETENTENSTQIGKDVKSLYEILSLYSPSPYQNYTAIRETFVKFLELCSLDNPPLEKTAIVSALIGRENHYLIEEFFRVEHEIFVKCGQIPQGLHTEEVDENQKLLLHISQERVTSEKLHQQFLMCYTKKQHFLNSIVDTSVLLIKHGLFKELGILLSPQIFNPLRPFILLYGWSYCQSCGHAKLLLETLRTDQWKSLHPVLDSACSKLAYQIDLIQWCLDRTKPLLPLTDKSQSSYHQRAADLFSGLENHSVLYVLHQSTRLSSLEHQEVLNLLQKSPLQKDQETSGVKKCNKSVRFEDAADENSEKAIHIERRRDISIFTGYCAIKNVMDAIYFCADCVHKKNLPHADASNNAISLKGAEKHLNDVECNQKNESYNIQKEYSKNVTQKLAVTKENLCRLQPLTFRVEMLENVFSLLFLTHEEIQESSAIFDSDSEHSEDDDRGRSNTLVAQEMSVQSEDNMSPLSPNQEEGISIYSQHNTTSDLSAPVPGSYDEPFIEVTPPVKTRKISRSDSTEIQKSIYFERLTKLKEKLRQEKGSGYGSTLSTGSTNSFHKLGFLCNEYVVRDILALLKDSLLDLSTARFQVMGKEKEIQGKNSMSLIDVELEEPLSHLVQSSVSKETLQKSISQLQQYVSEAQWRFQLVCHEAIPRVPGKVLETPLDFAEEEVDEEVRFCVQQKNGMAKRARRISSSNTDSKSTELTSEKRIKKKRSRSKNRNKGRKIHLQMGIISSMLSPPETLLNMCIRKHNFTHATEVIKLLKLEEVPEAHEVKFAEIYSKCAKKLQQLPAGQGHTLKPGKVSMKGLASVAAAGVATVSVTSVAEEVVAEQTLPIIPCPNVRNSIPVKYLEYFDENNVSVMILFDMLCTACKSWDTCNNLIDVIKTKAFVRTSKSLSSQTEDKKKGDQRFTNISSLIVNLENLLQLGGDGDIPGISSQRDILSVLYRHSIQTFLQTSTLPMVTDDCLSYATMMIELKKVIDKTEQAFQQHNKMPLEGYIHKQIKSSPKASPRDSPRPSPKSEDVGQTDKPVLHIAMKHLIHVMQRHVPKDGICTFLTRRSIVSTGSRDYLQNLYDHLKGLAFVVAETEAKARDNMVTPKNYFHMLSEGPIDTLGRLMFSLRIFPDKLESVAKKLSLNLTQIIVQSCCTAVPSKHLTSPGSSLSSFDVGDDDVSSAAKSVHPETIVRSLLTRLVHLMKSVANRNSARGIFDITCGKILTKMTEYDEIVSGIKALRNIDLLQLKLREEKLCFYGNLQNLMFVHMCLENVKFTVTETEDSGSEQLYCDKCMVEQIMQLHMFKYRVGQLGNISLFDVKYIINHCGLPAPQEFGDLLKSRVSELDKDDPWCKYIIEPEPCLLFVSTICAESSPPLQVLVPELVRTQMQTAMKDYLERGVIIDKEDNTITIPELLMWYKQDFSSESESFTAEHEGILHVVEGSLSGATQQALREMLQQDRVHGYSENIDIQGRKELPFKVGINTFKKDFMIRFENEKDDFSKNHVTLFEKKHRRVNSLPKNLSLSFDHTGSKGKETVNKYQLTPQTLEYIKDESPLVATLVSLVCTDELDDIEEHLTEDHFTESLRSRSSSEMSLVDIRSYRYQKLTEDYPNLKGHILNYVIPIAGAEDAEILKSADPILKFISSNISEKVKSCMLNLHTSSHFQSVLMKILEDLMQEQKWPQMISILDNLPAVVIRNQLNLCILYDFTLVCHVTDIFKGSKVLDKAHTDMVVCCLHKFMNKETMVHVLLSVYKKIPLDQCIELFEMTFFFSITQPLESVVKTKLDELKMFLRITECAKTLQFKLSSRSSSFDFSEVKDDYYSCLEKFTDWRNIHSSKHNYDEVLSVLLKMGDYRIAKAWCRYVSFPYSKYLNVIEHQLFTLLENCKSDTTRAFLASISLKALDFCGAVQILEELKSTNENDCYNICEQLLQKLSNQKDVLFVVTYTLDHLQSGVSKDRQFELCQMQIGSKMLLCMPDNLVCEYSHLVYEPKLMLEQLLMNMKIELASTAFQKVHVDLENLSNSTQRFTQQDFNKLVAEYAIKALELIVVQFVETDKARSQSEVSIASNASSDKILDTPERSPTKRSSLTESVRVRRSVDLTGMNRTPSNLSAYIPNKSSGKKNKSSKFIMPAEPPPKEKWQKDSSTRICMVCCIEEFSMFNRRHHCRRCGRVVCASCSSKTSVIKGLEVRTCDDCYSQLFAPKKSEIEIYQQSSDNLSGSSVTSRTFGLGFPVISEDGEFGNLSDAIHHSQLMWKLKPKENDHNKIVREDFYYEQAPSTTLCLSLLNLHSKPHRCGHLMLEFCDDLSKYLKPISPGVPNPEVDYGLVLSMMKTLLIHAKMKFINIGDSEGLAQCEVYQSHIDLLGVLVEDNYTDLPSLQELTKTDYVTRMRDKLIKDERLHLAVEVSTKCGLDPSGVWAAWGMNCLHNGDYVKAREKFSRCLKPPSDRNQVSPVPKLLSDVIDYLESTPPAVIGHLHLMKNKLGTWQDLLSNPLTVMEDMNVDSVQFHECLYYLKTYASFSTIINFHRRNGRWMKAVQYILDQASKCSTEVYLDALLIPALKRGEIGKLTDQMVMLDPSLEKWSPFLTATCRYLVKQKYHRVLYEFQIFMKDFIRAAMTCITYFYQDGANSYLELYTRINYLHTALLHMQSYLDPSKWGSVRRPIQGTDSSVRLVQSPEDVSRNIKTVSIQIEITKFLYRCLTSTDGTASPLTYSNDNKASIIPTMFGNTKMRTDLVNMVLLSGSDITVAFDLSYKIIKEYKLGGTAIFTHAAREMAKQQRYPYVRYLLDAISKVGYGDDETIDEIVGACILVIADNPSEAKEAENLIKLLRKDSNKINAYILCGKLRSAYLMAVKAERVDDVQRIAGAAQRMGQTAVKNICTKWLQQREKS